MEQVNQVVKDALSEMQSHLPASMPVSGKPLKPEPEACASCGVAVEAVLFPAVPNLGMKERWCSGLYGNSCSACAEIEKSRRIIDQQRRENERIRALWIESLGGERAYAQYYLDTFTPKMTIPEGFPDNVNLYIQGPTGTGKTHLATGIARLAWNHPSQVRVCKPMDIFREIRRAENASEESEIIDSYVNGSVIVLDDVGVSKESEFSAQILYEIIDGRYMAMKGGLIITSNLSLDDLSDRMGNDRISSRLAQMCKVLMLTGKDHRLDLPASRRGGG